MPHSQTLEIHGHRGARGVRPENTFSAFEYALAAGVDAIELDVVVSHEKSLIVAHDPFVNTEICDGPYARQGKRTLYRTLTVEQIQKLNCAAQINPRFSEQIIESPQTIPTLAEVFEWLKTHEKPHAASVSLNIELKTVPALPELTLPPEEYAERILALIEKHQMQKRVIIQCFDHRVLRHLKAKAEQVPISLLLSSNLVNTSLLIEDLEPEYVSPNHLWLTKKEVEAIHQKGVKVVPWTVNDPSDWERLKDWGVDAIITDYPGQLKDYLAP